VQTLEDRTLLAADFSLIGQGLVDAIGGFQTALNEQVLDAETPLVGDQLKDEGSPGQALAAIVPDVSDFQNLITINDVETALAGAFGGALQGGIVTTGSDDMVVFEFSLFTSIVGAVGFDVGLPFLGLEIEGSVQAEVRATVNARVVVTPDEFFFDTSADNDLQLSLIVTAPGLTATGRFGFLTLQAADAGSEFRADYNINIITPNDRLSSFSNIDFQTNVTGVADINLDLIAALPGDTVTPRVLAQLNIDWGFDLADPEAELFGNAPEVAINDVRLDLGSFFSSFVAPIVEDVQEVLRPIEPVLDVLETEIPLLAQLNTLLDGDETPVRIVDLISDGDVQQFISDENASVAVLLDGFFVTDRANADGTGDDVPGSSPSTISRELRRGGSGREYSALTAQRQADRCRRERPLVRKPGRPELNAAVRQGLAQRWSSEQIAGRLPRDHPHTPAPRVSRQTIYRWLDSGCEDAEHFRSLLREGVRRPTLSNRPRKRLDCQTPAEVLEK